MANSGRVYIHFSFKRPKGENYAIFAAAAFTDREGTQRAKIKLVQKDILWKNQQFITAIQSYERVLSVIYGWQGDILAAGIKSVMLVTDNGILAKWIERPNKNKEYAEYMRRATEMYKVGGPNEIKVGIGLCVPLKYEKAYKFCKEDLVTVDRTINNDRKPEGKNLLPEVESMITIYETAQDVDKAIPEMDIEMVEPKVEAVESQEKNNINRIPVPSMGGSVRTIHNMFDSGDDAGTPVKL